MAHRPAVSRTVRLRSGRWTIGTVLSSTEAGGFLVCSLALGDVCLEGGRAVYAGRGVGRPRQGLHGSPDRPVARQGFDPAKVEFGLELRLSHALGLQARFETASALRRTSLESGWPAFWRVNRGAERSRSTSDSGPPRTEPHGETRRSHRAANRAARVPANSNRAFDRDVISPPGEFEAASHHRCSTDHQPSRQRACSDPHRLIHDPSLICSERLNDMRAEKVRSPEKKDVDEPGALWIACLSAWRQRPVARRTVIRAQPGLFGRHASDSRGCRRA